MTTGHATQTDPPGAPGRWTDARLGWLALVVILLVGLYLRTVDLEKQWIWIDEDLTWLATNGVLETGAPELPSGAAYDRAPLYTYIASGALWIARQTTDGELSPEASARALRVPSVVCSMLLILVVFFFGRALGGWGAGVTAALIIACSPWDVHYARMARMYELLVLLFTLTVFLSYRGLMEGDRRARVAMLATAVLAVMAHQQAAMLAVVFLVPFLFPRHARPRAGWLISGVIVTVVAFKYAGDVVGWFSSGAGGGLDIIGRKDIESTFTIPVIGILVDLNHARFLLLESLRANVIVGVLGVLGVLSAGAWNVVRLAHEHKTLAAGSAVVFGLALLFNQYVIAAVAAVLTVKFAETTVSGGMRRGMDLGIAVVGALFFTLCAVGLSLGVDALTDRMVLRAFLAVPVPWYKKLFMAYPWMCAVVLAGIGVYYLRALRPGASQRILFVFAALAAPLIGQGVIYSPYFGHRYNFYLNPLMVLLFTMCVVPIVQFLTAAVAPRPRRIAVATTMVGVVLVIFCSAFQPVEAYNVHLRDPGYSRERFRHPDLNASYNYDFANTSAFVKTHRSEGDIVIVRDPVNLYPYMGRTDYVVSAKYDGFARDSEGNLVDYYIGIPYIGDADQLVRVLNAHTGVNRWIIYTMSGGPHGPDTNLPVDILDYLTALKRTHPPFTGDDGTTVVLRIPAGEHAKSPSEISPAGGVASSD